MRGRNIAFIKANTVVSFYSLIHAKHVFCLFTWFWTEPLRKKCLWSTWVSYILRVLLWIWLFLPIWSFHSQQKQVKPSSNNVDFNRISNKYNFRIFFFPKRCSHCLGEWKFSFKMIDFNNLYILEQFYIYKKVTRLVQSFYMPLNHFPWVLIFYITMVHL